MSVISRSRRDLLAQRVLNPIPPFPALSCTCTRPHVYGIVPAPPSWPGFPASWDPNSYFVQIVVCTTPKLFGYTYRMTTRDAQSDSVC